jgi:fructose-bisphosphate aldolase class I
MEPKKSEAHTLAKTAQALVAADKGLLAMDESNPTCNKRFAQFGIPQTPEARRQYRDLIVTTPDLGKYISGAILYDETIRQRTNDGTSFIDKLLHAGIIPGIKADLGITDLAGFPGEKVTQGLDGLRSRLSEYVGMGLRFAKWRAVISIGNGIPTDSCIADNMQTLSEYAALCQEAGIMPIVEPEVLMDGDHSIEQCAEVTEKVLHVLFGELYKQRIDLDGMLLKPNMVTAGKSSIKQNTITEVAEATVKCLLKCVPAEVPGIAFLSGGQSSELATYHLNEMSRLYKSSAPWALTFSFSRAIQLPALEIWKGREENKVAAQQELLYRAKCNSEARWGDYGFAVVPVP